MKIAGIDVVVQSNPVRNLGVMFDPGMTMATQVSNIVKSANYHLMNIRRARRLLTDDATKLAVHTLVTSRLERTPNVESDLARSVVVVVVKWYSSKEFVDREREFEQVLISNSESRNSFSRL